jgi:hypothetical protein
VGFITFVTACFLRWCKFSTLSLRVRESKMLTMDSTLVVLVSNWAQRHKDVCGSGGMNPRIFNVGKRWRWMVNFTSSCFILGERALPTEEKADYAPQQLWTLQMPGNKPRTSVVQPVPVIFNMWTWKLRNEKLYDLHSTPNIIRVIVPIKLRQAGHVARMGERRGA